MKDNKYYEDLEKEGYYETIDKRSKDYRGYKEYLKIKDEEVNTVIKEQWNTVVENVEKDNTVGLGDVVEKIAKVTGIKKVVEAIIDDCGCDERKEKFNKVSLWKRRNISCISEEDYKWYVTENIAKKNKWSFQEREKLVTVYNSIFNTKVKNSNCSSCIKGYQDNLNKYINIYNS